MRFLLLFIVTFLTACNARMYIDQQPGNSGQSLSPGETASFRFFTSEPAAHSGLNLSSGATYSLQFPTLSNWIDGTIAQDEHGRPLGVRGFADSLMPTDSFALLKRSWQHRWFELMMYQDGCRRNSLIGISELNYNEADASYLYRAPCSGDLKLFVNDSQGYYINNSGFATIRITRID